MPAHRKANVMPNPVSSDEVSASTNSRAMLLFSFGVFSRYLKFLDAGFTYTRNTENSTKDAKMKVLKIAKKYLACTGE